MNLLKKAAVFLAATSMVAAPVAASAAQAVEGVRAVSTTERESELEGSWIYLALAAVAVIVGVVLLTDDNDSPTSP